MIVVLPLLEHVVCRRQRPVQSGEIPQTLGVPEPPHVAGKEQVLPQVSWPPHPSSSVPQLLPQDCCGTQVVVDVVREVLVRVRVAVDVGHKVDTTVLVETETEIEIEIDVETDVVVETTVFVETAVVVTVDVKVAVAIFVKVNENVVGTSIVVGTVTVVVETSVCVGPIPRTGMSKAKNAGRPCACCV